MQVDAPIFVASQREGCQLPPLDQLPMALAQAVRVWHAMRPDQDLLPNWSQFDPISVPDALGMISLLEVCHPGPRFFCRLYGTRLYAAHGHDMTGSMMDEAVPNFVGSSAEADYMAVAESRRPRWYRGAPSLWSPRRIGEVELVILPFAADGRQVDRIMLVVDFPTA